jgi:hypothetical protein
MKAIIISTAAIAGVLVSSGVAHPIYGQTPPKPVAAAVIVASEARAVVESVDKQARQVLLHLPEDAVKYFDATLIHLVKTTAASTAKPALGTSASGEIKGVRTVVGIDPSRGTITLADARNQVETLGVPDPSMLATLKPGDNVDVIYKEAIDVSLEPV